jgi:hypothetical protein
LSKENRRSVRPQKRGWSTSKQRGSPIMFITIHLNAAQILNFMSVNRTVENVAKLKFIGMAVTNQICIDEEIKSRLNSENA